VGFVSGDFVAILDGILEGFQVVAPDLRYLHVNDAAARHGRSTKEALLGRTMMECYPGIEQSEVFALIQRSLADRSSHTLENAFTFPDGSVGHFELRIEPVPQGVCVLSIDITARKHAEAARAQVEARLRHAERMEMVGQLAAGIAHDFNNHLTIILGLAELSLRRPAGPTRGDVETLLVSARSSAELTRQLLTYGRGTIVARQVVDLADVVRGLDRILQSSLGERIELSLDTPAGVPPVEADRSQLEQILMNLVLNARDAIEGEGRITVSLARAELDDAHVREHPGARPGPHAVLIVTDTGAGMDEATRAHIFEPFFTTKERGQGTGLGLSTVYGIVRQHGGTVWVYSELGKGTTFKVYLPAAERVAAPSVPAPAPPLPAPSRPATTTAGATILVVDDAPLLRKLIEALCTTAGYRVLVAARAEEALALWDEHEAGIALLITDVVMPGLGGAGLIDRLRSRRPGLPVICTSGYSSADLVARGALPANVAFVEKPFTAKALLGEIEALLGE
jgi:PAS domain S-box-containing protein